MTPTPDLIEGKLVRPGAVLRAPRARRPPAIDGLLDEWQGEGTEVNAVVFGPENYSGTEDLQAQAWWVWDNVNLYLAVDVRDDFFSQPSQGASLQLGDSIELQWDVELARDYDSDRPDADDWHIGLSPGNFLTIKPEAYVWAPRAIPGWTTGIRVAARPKGTAEVATGYSLEAAIPWALIKATPGIGLVYGFTLSVSDTDAPARVQHSMLSTSPTRQKLRPTTFNTLLLER
jgi:hypothetical protein